MTLIKAAVPNSISEEDLVSAEAQQDCRPQIRIHFSPPGAFDFTLDPWSFAASCKNGKISLDSEASAELFIHSFKKKSNSNLGPLAVHDSIKDGQKACTYTIT